MISVLMSVYNERLDWIKCAIDSILSQTYQDFEFIIIIDNPYIEKEKLEYLNDIQKKDERIIILKNDKNMGLALSMNKGLEVAKGKYIARMDADDISMPMRFEKEVAYIENNKVDMVSSNRIIIDEDGNFIRKGEPLLEDPDVCLPFSNFIVHPSVLIKTEVINHLGGYRNFRRSQDYDLWLRLISCGYKIGIIDEYLIKYRVSESNLSNSNRLEQYYINQYQKKLYYERLEKGYDTFSEQQLLDYLLKKKITQRKNKACVKAMRVLDMAKSVASENKILFLLFILKAFVVSPLISTSVIKNYLDKQRCLRKR